MRRQSPWATLVIAVGCMAWLALAPQARAANTPPAVPAPAVLEPAAPDAGTAPTAAGVRSAIGARVASDLSNGAALVIDPASGAVLYSSSATKAFIPASNAKLATAVAALKILGPNTRIATTVVATERDIYLVGGGDPTLAGGGRAPGIPTLTQLADTTAKQVGTDTPLTLFYDDSFFTGPRLAPGWSPSFPTIGEVAPITALMVDQGRRAPTTNSRVKDPARQAGQKFAELLRAAGVKVTAVSAAKAPADATVIAKVESPPVDRIVQVMLTESENTYAEMLAHLVGGAAVGKASFAGGGEATRGVLAAIDIDTGGYFLADGSGLSRDDRLTATTLASILATVVRGSHPELSSIATGLPIAGLTGTLADRYELLAAQAGRGFVHAKTGTLTGVVAESGIVLDASGRQLVFSFIATRVRSIDAMRRTLDGLASTLATCGCTS